MTSNTEPEDTMQLSATDTATDTATEPVGLVELIPVSVDVEAIAERLRIHEATHYEGWPPNLARMLVGAAICRES